MKGAVTITYPNKMTVLVDPEDVQLASGSMWWANRNGYVVRKKNVEGKRVEECMHRIIAGAPIGSKVTHINTNKFDNRRHNLRFVEYTPTITYQDGVALVKFTNGSFTIVDCEDVPLVSEKTWFSDVKGYIIRNSPRLHKNGKRGTVHLHRVILNAPVGMEVDHINGVKYDNRRSNLRLCSRIDNLRNQGARKHNRCGLKGVTLNKKSQKFQSRILFDGVRTHLGYFDTAAEAHEAYCSKARVLHGEFFNPGYRCQ